MYQMGFRFGRHWAMRDATLAQLEQVNEFDDGRTWTATKADPAKDFTRIVDPGRSDFMGIGDSPSASFVAGFIDGANSIDLSTKRDLVVLTLTD